MLIDYIYPICVKITEEIFVKNIEITWINTSVCFNNILDSAESTLLTGFWIITHCDCNIVFELTDKWLLSLL